MSLPVALSPRRQRTCATARGARPMIRVSMPTSAVARRRHPLVRHAQVAQWRFSRLGPGVHALMWSALAGFLFILLNSVMRGLSIALDPFQTQFLRYLMGVAVMLPLVWRGGLAAYRPKNTTGHFTRGAVHTFGLVLWFIAIPHITIADTTAIGFTGPIFIMLG